MTYISPYFDTRLREVHKQVHATFCDIAWEMNTEFILNSIDKKMSMQSTDNYKENNTTHWQRKNKIECFNEREYFNERIKNNNNVTTGVA